ncbi:unnamed protein product [Pieris brassicae]|uniref:Uncharacterized protein n=1 Tax=Pieris brassicae TaxID=7116 RepID=A0A9P0TVI3_PIEBR|nr:unnamed protein product [Pieris brassicae]
MSFGKGPRVLDENGIAMTATEESRDVDPTGIVSDVKTAEETTESAVEGIVIVLSITSDIAYRVNSYQDFLLTWVHLLFRS